MFFNHLLTFANTLFLNVHFFNQGWNRGFKNVLPYRSHNVVKSRVRDKVEIGSSDKLVGKSKLFDGRVFY